MQTTPHVPHRVSFGSLLDRGEQIAAVALFSWLCLRVLDSGNAFAPLLLASEGLVVAFLVVRRPSSGLSLNIADWALAFGATIAPLLIDPGGQQSSRFAGAGVLLFALGTGWQLWAKLTLRRSFGIAPANRGVKVSGPYRTMRHPMYFGYFVTQLGILLLMFSTWNLAIYLVTWSLQMLRLRREEALLLQDPAYGAFAIAVPWRIIPRVY